LCLRLSIAVPVRRVERLSWIRLVAVAAEVRFGTWVRRFELVSGLP
jgi:hypothetical protein